MVKQTFLIKHTPYIFQNNKLILSESIEKEIDFLPEFNSLEKKDIVSIHWDFVVDKLDKNELENLEKYNLKNINSLN